MDCKTNHAESLILRFLLCEALLNYVLKFQRPRNIRKALDEAMPTELFDLYEIVMSRITQLEDDSKQLALETLSWVLYAKRPLHIDELQEAITIEEGDRGLDKEDLPLAQTLVEVCGSLIVYDKVSGVVGLTHETVKEFLLSRHSRQLSSEVDIARTCLTCLLFDIFNGPCASEESLVARLHECSISRYAAQFWGIHTRGEAERNPYIQQAVLSLLTSENKKNSMLQMEAYNSTWPTITFTWGQTLLHVIAAKGLAIMCRLVLCHILNHRYTLSTPSTLIESDRERSQPVMLNSLPTAGTNINAKDNDGQTALYLAAEEGHKEVVQQLLGKDADVDAQGGYYG